MALADKLTLVPSAQYGVIYGRFVQGVGGPSLVSGTDEDPDAALSPVPGLRITFKPSTDLMISDPATQDSFAPVAYTAYTDGDGFFEISLFATDLKNASVENWFWEAEVYSQNPGSRAFRVGSTTSLKGLEVKANRAVWLGDIITSQEASGDYVVQGKSAYQFAVEGGYEGTEEEFAVVLNDTFDLAANVDAKFAEYTVDLTAATDEALATANQAYEYNQALVAPAADAINTVLADETSAARQTLARIAPVYDLTPTGTAQDAVNVIAVAEEIAPTGRKVIHLSPGYYDFSNVTVADIKGLYLAGDGVTVSPSSYVYPFTTAELAGSSVERSKGAGGRGRVAFELDDGLMDHWRHIFPLTKELGITLGSVWHTAQDSPWITEAHRHGWEIMSHLPENITAVDYYNEGRLDEIAVQTLDRIEEMIGTRDNIGFVYPQHVRNNDTDRVLSKYFTRGRGIANTITYTPDHPNPWLTASWIIDPVLESGVISSDLRNTIRSLANNNQSMVFYFHYHSSAGEVKKDTLRKLVALLRAEGVEIVNPGQIVGDHNIIPDRFFEDTSQWSVTGPAEFDTSSSYHGARSVKINGAPGGHGVVRGLDQVQVPTKPGMFTVVRGSWRRKSSGDVTVSGNGQGFRLQAAVSHRTWASGMAAPATRDMSVRWPQSGVVLPSTEGQWVREQTLCYLPPSTQISSFNLAGYNLVAGSADMWVDEFQVLHVGYVASVTHRVKLDGTGRVTVRTGIPGVSDHVIGIEPTAPLKGTVSCSVVGHDSLYITSTSAEDVGEIDVVITPRGSVAAPLTSEGA